MQLAWDLPALVASDVRISDELVLKDHRLVASVRLSFLTLPRMLYKNNWFIQLIKHLNYRAIAKESMNLSAAKESSFNKSQLLDEYANERTIEWTENSIQWMIAWSFKELTVQ